jgi:uncharacterized membrane protein YkvA (DUF1232 family)
MKNEETTEHTTQSTTQQAVSSGFLTGLVDAVLDTDLKKKVASVIAILFGILYILNPGGGFVEAIPDVIPFVGNLDEAAATAIALWGLQYLTQGNRQQTTNVIDHDEMLRQERHQLPDTAETTNKQ